MAYTPYSQALPDTSRYTLDPVLQERLYQPVRPDPYQSGMLNTAANDYYADPFGYTNRRFGALDETLATDTPDVGLGGMFAPYLKNEGSPGDSIGLTEDQIAFLDAEAAIPGARDARMGKINSLLSIVAQGLVPGLPTMSIAQMGLEAYNDMMQGHGRTVAGDTSGYTGSSPTVPGRQPGRPAPVVTAEDLAVMQNPVYSAPAYQAGNDGDSTSNTPDADTGARRVEYDLGAWALSFERALGLETQRKHLGASATRL